MFISEQLRRLVSGKLETNLFGSCWKLKGTCSLDIKNLHVSPFVPMPCRNMSISNGVSGRVFLHNTPPKMTVYVKETFLWKYLMEAMHTFILSFQRNLFFEGLSKDTSLFEELPTSDQCQILKAPRTENKSLQVAYQHLASDTTLSRNAAM